MKKEIMRIIRINIGNNKTLKLEVGKKILNAYLFKTGQCFQSYISSLVFKNIYGHDVV